MTTLGLTDTVASIRQCIRIILSTSKGEVPWRPNFGLSPETLLDGQAKDIDISFAVIDQLSKYEKRIKVKKVSVETVDAGHKRVTIYYSIIEEKINDILTLEI
jgi:phage baseplate assembly protein W